MPLAAGTHLGSYEVLSLLGAGGMGEVYRARDSRLGRDVALKVLPADVARDRTRLDRFRREAKALAAIDHPNIVTVFSVEEAPNQGQEGIHFLTMQLVEGQSLDHLVPTGGLPVDQFFHIASAIAEALTAAHDKHIVHRDLKPANVMVAADGRVKVLDFGLAKDLAGSGPADATLTSAGHTEHGVVMGTPAYMSPEQVAGRAVDHRSDIFSLGILLYQMASGERPFAGASSAELASSILRDTPPLITELRRDLPADLGRLIRRCLEKEPSQRIQTARDVANECRDLSRRVAQSGGTPGAAPRAGATGSSKPGPRPDEGFWVAVLPFKYSGSDSALAGLAEGLVEEIVTGLSRFSYLRVIVRNSASGDNARYVMEGSLRQAGSQLRVAVQLVDAVSGAHLWAETFDRLFEPNDIFKLQDELVPRIVSTVADQHGVLVHNMSVQIRRKDDAELNAHEAALCVFGFHERMTSEEHARVRAILERAVKLTPDDSDCWAMLATIYTDEHMFGFNVLPDSLGRAQAAARRAVELSPASALASQALAQSFFFRRELDACRPVAERTIALNPMDGAIGAFMGLLLALCGDWERGCDVTDRARKLNPHFPGWYWLTPAFSAYQKGDYREAIALAKRVNIPGYFWVPATTAAALGQLGDLDAAETALRELLVIRPEFGSIARAEFSKWFQPDLVDTFLDGLQKAGLETETREVVATSRSTDSGASAVQRTRSIAVLPFTNLGGDQEQEYFSEGLAEEIINSLAHVDGLKVAARTSAFSFKGKNVNVSTIATTLGVDSILEGSVRRSGQRLRVSVQLIDAGNGYQLWSERYDREMSDIFALQDDITLAVVAALKVKLLGDARMTVLKRHTDNPEAYELFLKGRYHSNKYTAQGWQRAMEYFEKAIAVEPDYALAYAGIATTRVCQWFFGILPAEQTIPQCRAAYMRALAMDEGLANALLAQGMVEFFYDWDWPHADQTLSKSIAANPNDAFALSSCALFLAFAGRFDEATRMGRQALVVDPLAPFTNMNVGWTFFSVGMLAEASQQAAKMIESDADFYGAYWLQGAIHLCSGEFEQAVAQLRTAVSLGAHQVVVADLASACGLAGYTEEAATLLNRLLDVRRQQYVPAIYLARVYSRIGETSMAVEWIETAFAERNGELVFLQGEIAGAAEGDPWRKLADEPRVMALLDSMHLP